MGCLITNVYLTNAKKSQVKLLSSIKKDSLWICQPHRTVLINNKTTKQPYLFFCYVYGLLPVGSEMREEVAPLEGSRLAVLRWRRLAVKWRSMMCVARLGQDWQGENLVVFTCVSRSGEMLMRIWSGVM